MALVVETVFVAVDRLEADLTRPGAVQIDDLEFENANKPRALSRAPGELRGIFYRGQQCFLNAIGDIIVAVDAALCIGIERVAMRFE